MLFSILTLFPSPVEAYLGAGILGLARARGIVRTNVIDLRDFSRDRHRTVDDRPFGGGPGMVLKPEPIVDAVEWIEAHHGPHRRIALTPDGTPFQQLHAERIHDSDDAVLLLCGRYEGFDERALEHLDFERFSVGDYVLAGGELAALIVVEATTRLFEGALGHEQSAAEDSFTNGGLDHPHYTRPRTFRGLEVPDVLLGGDHAEIADWRRAKSEERTRERRPDLLRGDRPHDNK